MTTMFNTAIARTRRVFGNLLAGALRSALLLTEAAARQKIILAGYDAPIATHAELQRHQHALKSAELR